MLVLAIESSCDETAAAVIENGCKICSSIVSSQVDIHAKYGGVVPEIASRRHIDAVIPVIEETLVSAGVILSDIDGIAATQGPGLAGALLVGINAAKGLALAQNIPIVGVHHIEGHILAAKLENHIDFPFLALVISGGHTSIYDVVGFGDYKVLGETMDDAAGEAFDKAGKMLGLSYPAGHQIDALSLKGDPAAFTLPRPLLREKGFSFSFSGLKTAMLSQVKKCGENITEDVKADLCASFQRAVCDVLVSKCAFAFEYTGRKTLVVAGGVASNSEVRSSMAKLADKMNVTLYIPSPALCGDNAAMLGVSSFHHLSNGFRTPLELLDAVPVWSLSESTKFIRRI